MTEHWLRTIRSVNPQHSMLQPYCPIELCLLAHVPNNLDELFAGTYVGQVVMLYPARMLDKIFGGASVLFRSLDVLLRLVGLMPYELGYLKPLHVQNMAAGI